MKIKSSSLHKELGKKEVFLSAWAEEWLAQAVAQQWPEPRIGQELLKSDDVAKTEGDREHSSWVGVALPPAAEESWDKPAIFWIFPLGKQETLDSMLTRFCKARETVFPP